MLLFGALSLVVLLIVLLACNQQRAALILLAFAAVCILGVIAAALWAMCALGGCHQ